MGAEFVALSLPPMLIGSLAAVACALPGNFLVLRRQSLLGDAVSHVVLPGIVGAFLLTGGASPPAMVAGAIAAALVAVLLIELLRRATAIDPGAAMGVVFTAMFAAGVLLLELSGAGGVHLDVDHALMGSLESLVWLEAGGWHALLDPVALRGLPAELAVMAAAAAALALALGLFWRPLVAATFDEAFARAQGLPVTAISLGLTMATAVACVAAFSAVGAILVIAMLVCPPAAARLMTDRLSHQVAWSVGFALLAANLGYVLAGYGPVWLGSDRAVSAAGMIAVVAGAILAAAALAGPCRRRRAAG